MRFGKLMRVARILRTLRLLRLAKMKALVAAIHDRLDSEFLTIGLNVLKLMAMIVAINHLIACLWFKLGSVKHDNFDSWVYKYKFEAQPLEYQYLSSLHWSLTQFTPASMNVQPVNTSERLFAVLVLLFAMIVFSSFVSSITAAMNQLRNLTAKNGSHLWLMRKYLREQNVSPDLYHRLIRYARITSERHEAKVQKKDVLFLSLLSIPLHNELAAELYQSVLTINPLLQRLSKKCNAMLQRLCSTAVKQVSLSTGDILFDVGAEAEGMYLLNQGSMKYKSLSNGTMGAWNPFKSGEWCCEAALWVPWVHCGKLRAFRDSELVMLDSGKFRAAAALHPRHLVWLRNYSKEFCSQLNQRFPENTDLDTIMADSPFLGRHGSVFGSEAFCEQSGSEVVPEQPASLTRLGL